MPKQNAKEATFLTFSRAIFSELNASKHIATNFSTINEGHGAVGRDSFL